MRYRNPVVLNERVSKFQCSFGEITERRGFWIFARDRKHFVYQARRGVAWRFAATAKVCPPCVQTIMGEP